MKKKEKKKKQKYQCICCGTLITFPYSDCFLCCVCETVTDLSTPLLSYPLINIQLDDDDCINIPGTSKFISLLEKSLSSGNLEEGRSLIFNAYSSVQYLESSFVNSSNPMIINSHSFDSFYTQFTDLKCPFFIQTLMASIDHLVRRPGKITSIRWIIVVLLTPFLSRKKNRMEGNFHHSLVRRLFSLLRRFLVDNSHVYSNEFCSIINEFPSPYLRRLAELANWTLNMRIGRLSSTSGHLPKTRAKILVSDWVVLGASFMLQSISESNSGKLRIEPSELYSLSIDLLPLNVILADWQASGMASIYIRRNVVRLCACGRCNPLLTMARCLKSQKKAIYDRDQMKGHFTPTKQKSLIAQFPSLLSLGIKSKILESELIPNGSYDGLIPLNIKVVRSPIERLLHSSMQQVFNAAIPQLRGRVKIEFQGEPGIDAGGLLREWLQLLVNILMHPIIGVFGDEDGDSSSDGYIRTYEASAPCVWFASYNENYHSHKPFAYARFFGILLGIALNNGIVLEHKLPFAVFKKLLFPESKPPSGLASQHESLDYLTLDDLSEICPQLSRGLGQLLSFQDPYSKEEMNFEETFNLQFTAGFSSSKKSSVSISELIEGGSDISVTIENRDIFISLYIDHIFNVRPQSLFYEFRLGFYSALAGTSLSLHSPKEFQLLLSGDVDDISIDLLRSVAYYEGYINQGHQVSIWLWEIISSFSPGMRRKFLIFVSGVGRIPAALAATGAAGHSGMINQTCPWIFRIWGMDTYWISPSGGENRPLGRTCFNQLCLNKGYPDKATLERLLLSAILDSEGFGIQ